MESYLSNRGRECLEMSTPAQNLLDSYWNDPWSPDNPAGNVNMSTADNNLSCDLITEKLSSKEFSDALISPEIFAYPKPGGMPNTLKSLSKFITKYFEAEKQIETEHLCIVPGVTAAFEMIAAAICNPYEAILCPAPHYVRINNAFGVRAQVKIIPVSMIDEHNTDGKFHLTVEAISQAYEQATAKGTKIRAILILNPNNPLGSIIKSEPLMEILNYAKKKKLMVLMNEIYTMSIFDENSGFRSILSYFSQLADPQRIIWMWGMSKDFCIPGMRFGTIYCQNEEILECLRRFHRLQCTASPIENVITLLVSDYEWLEKYFAENRLRLRSAFNYASERLTEMNVPHTKTQAGFFTFLNVRKFLKTETFEEERKLGIEFEKNGVFLLTGKSQQCCQPGWFRMIFTGQRNELDEGLNRIEKTLSTYSR